MNTVLQWAGVLALGALAGTSWANGPEAPLPPVETVLERALARAHQEAANDRDFKATYYFTGNRTNEYRNIRGNLTKRRVKTNVNQPTANRPAEIVTLTAASGSANTNRLSSDTSQHKRELLDNTNLVSRFTFELRGRELVGNRPALVVEFKPSGKKLPAANLKERCLSKVAGRVWLDEEEYAVVKAEARLTEGVDVLGGLAGAVHKFQFSFGRERTEDGLWYTRLLTWHLQMREIIVERTIDCVETKTDVRKVR